jgi:hypothetical protein
MTRARDSKGRFCRREDVMPSSLPPLPPPTPRWMIVLGCAWDWWWDWEYGSAFVGLKAMVTFIAAAMLLAYVVAPVLRTLTRYGP